jgi:hypothetical protein
MPCTPGEATAGIPANVNAAFDTAVNDVFVAANVAVCEA